MGGFSRALYDESGLLSRRTDMKSGTKLPCFCVKNLLCASEFHDG